MSSRVATTARSRGRVLIVTAVVALAATAVVGGLAVAREGGGVPTTAGAPFGMAHVHGLGVDPQDGALLAGTHYGAFRVAPDGSVEQVGPTQDVMGFTVAGPRHYLASGHPGADQPDAPPLLGLLESTDGGQSWRSVSLRGEADFHALEARHGRVYGHSGGRLLVSADMSGWDERAGIEIADLAVSPDDPDTVLATTEQGLSLSADGGRSFDAVAGAPLLVLVSWDEDGTVLGVDPQGGVHASLDAGTSWEQRGTAGGPPAAMTVTAEAVYVATTDARIVQSTDGGRVFTVRYQERRR